MITIREIAELAGTSRGTVDRVLKGRGGVREETRLLIERICREQGYRPNLAGVLLGRQGREFRIGAILPSLSDPGFDGIVRGLEAAEAEFADFGVSLELYELGFDAGEQLAAAERLERSGMKGLILSPVPDPALGRRIAALAERGIPSVTLGREAGGERLSHVRCSPSKSGGTAAELCGLLAGGAGIAVGVMSGRAVYPEHAEWVSHFCEAVKQVKRVSVRRIAACGDTEAETADKVGKMLANYPEIGCVLAAPGALSAVLGALDGRKIPVIATDTDSEAEDLLKTGRIPLAISQQGAEQGRLAVKLLVDSCVKGREVPALVEVPPVVKSRFCF